MTTQTSRSTKSTPKQARLRQLPDGRIEALSSNGRAVYDVTIGKVTSCTCPGFQHYGYCYHVFNAIQRFAAMWPLPARKPANVTPLRPRAKASDLYAE